MQRCFYRLLLDRGALVSANDGGGRENHYSRVSEAAEGRGRWWCERKKRGRGKGEVRRKVKGKARYSAGKRRDGKELGMRTITQVFLKLAREGKGRLNDSREREGNGEREIERKKRNGDRKRRGEE